MEFLLLLLLENLCLLICLRMLSCTLRDANYKQKLANLFFLWRKRGTLAVLRKVAYYLDDRTLRLHTNGAVSRFSDAYLHIAFRPTGGMGDYIISARVLEDLQALAPVRLDVYAEKLVFGHAIYGNRPGVKVLPEERFWECCGKYDLALTVEHFIHVEMVDRKRVRKISKDIYGRLRYLEKHWKKLYVDIPQQCWRERVQFERCRLLGLDRWTEQRMGAFLPIRSRKVYIPLLDRFEKMYLAQPFHGKRYITINYGADKMRPGQVQLKLWPKGHLREFVRQFKTVHPDILVLQLGAKDAERIPCVDDYVLGESIELTKFILRDSLCHVDCEGGLVHLAHQFDTRSVVVFGPTPVHMYGYRENINLTSAKCQNCMGLHADWAYRCWREEKEPPCMYGIAPAAVLAGVEEILEEKP